MFLTGKIFKNEKHWIIEVPSLDIMTQGKTKKVACAMLTDALRALLNNKHFKVILTLLHHDQFLLETHHETELLALLLKRQRAKYGLSLSEMAKKLKTNSKNTYAQYEQGKSQPSLSKLQEFLSAMNTQLKLSLSVVM